MTSPPPGICPRCFASLRGHWVEDFFQFCEHRGLLARRRSRQDDWKLTKGVTVGAATRHLGAALAKATARARSKGLTFAQANELMQDLREFEVNGTQLPSKWGPLLAKGPADDPAGP